MAKSDKLYSRSPSIKRNEESGEPEVKRPSAADGENMGTEGDPAVAGTDGEMPVNTHQAEHEELSKRHVQELKDMHKRHMTDYEAMNARHHSSGDVSAETANESKDS